MSNWSNAPRAPKITPIRRNNYEHMESIIKPVRQVCPKTGDYIDEVPVDYKLIVKRHLLFDKSLVEGLVPFRDKGIENLTEADYKKAHKIIKGFNKCKQIHYSS